MTILGLGDPSAGPDAFRIDDHVLRALRDGLPSVASQTLVAVMAEVPGYRVGFRGPMGESIKAAVQMAIGGFLKLAGGSSDVDPSTPRRTTLEGAYALGRGEARAGRSMDALLAAYRVGARVSWRGLARNAAEAGLPGLGDGRVRRAAVRLHRRALRRQRRRLQRRAQHQWAGPGALPRAPRSTAAGRRRPGRAGGGRRTSGVGATGVADSGAAARRPGARGARPGQPRHVAGHRGPARLGQLGRRAAVRAAAGARRGRGRPATSAAGARPTAGRGRSAARLGRRPRLVRPRGADGGSRRCSPGARPTRSTARTTSSISS